MPHDKRIHLQLVRRLPVWALVASATLAPSQVRPPEARPTIVDGAVTYTAEDGRRRTIDVGAKCRDLWVAPDESAIAFVAIEDQRASGYIERSAVFVALRSDHYRPVRLPVTVVIAGQTWRVASAPEVSPDLKSVYFLAPYEAVGYILVKEPLNGGASHVIGGDLSNYCVVWGGPRAGDLAMLTRREPDPNLVGDTVTYPCEVRSPDGGSTKLDSGDCWAKFSAVVAEWSARHGGACR